MGIQQSVDANTEKLASDVLKQKLADKHNPEYRQTVIS